MLKQAITSVTFRALGPEEIIALATRAGLDAIEWGGDIHVPHGDVDTAKRIGRLTREAGLAVCAYGSYFRAGTYADEQAAFAPVLQSAVALGAPLIRVWAGDRGSAEYGEDETVRLFTALVTITDMAAREGIRVATEYHANTFTDTLASVERMLEAVPALRTFWQPPVGLSHADNLLALSRLAGRVESLHVFEWTPDGARRPLAEGAERWQAYLRAAAAWPSEHHATMEFVLGDSPEQFLADAQALREMVHLSNL